MPSKTQNSSAAMMFLDLLWGEYCLTSVVNAVIKFLYKSCCCSGEGPVGAHWAIRNILYCAPTPHHPSLIARPVYVTQGMRGRRPHACAQRLAKGLRRPLRRQRITNVSPCEGLCDGLRSACECLCEGIAKAFAKAFATGTLRDGLCL